MSQYTENRKIRCMCINCLRTIAAEPTLAGTKQQCPKCGNQVFIPKASLKPGELVGNYLIDKLIGVGGMGEVYQVQSTVDQKDYALKVIRPSIINDAEIESFKNEIRMNLRVSHSNFIRAYESGTDKNGRLFLAMEFVKGRTLEDHIVQNGRLEENHVLSIALTVATALKSAWDNWQIIHRDLKPANILITPANIIKIMDLGVSVNVSENAGESHIIGTPYYMSPEQIETPSEIDQRSDIFSLGATMYELITGVEPFKGKTSDDIFDSVLQDIPDPPANVRPDVSADTCDLIRLFMKKDRDKRPLNWEEAIAAIEKTIHRYETEDRGTSTIFKNPQLMYKMQNDMKAYTGFFILVALFVISFLAMAIWVAISYTP